MKKPTLLAPRNQAREITSEVDAQRMMESGSYVECTIPKKPSKALIAQRALDQRKREAGLRILHVALPPAVLDAIHARLREGETMARLIERLISESDTNENS
ncbi:hypothetical protein D3C78_270860 [compost metagenome]